MKNKSKQLNNIVLLLVLIFFNSCGMGEKKEEKNEQSIPESNSSTKLLKFSNTTELSGIYPEIYEDSLFVNWLDGKTISNWHETEMYDENKRNVIVQSKNSNSINAFQVSIDNEGNSYILNHKEFKIQSWPEEDLMNLTEKNLIKADNYSNDDVILRPKVDFSKEPKLNWEVEILGKESNHLFEIDIEKMEVLNDTILNFSSTILDDEIKVTADDLASNELHHLANFKAEATKWLKGQNNLSTQRKARIIFENVRKTYSYDGNIKHILEFTWSDNLIRTTNRRKGVCDEYAVVQVSYLRSIGIQARIKFLAWEKPDGTSTAHAAVEFKDGTRWIHMDALWRAFRGNDVYRRRAGAKKVTVMDADYPKDSRSNKPAWGVTDRNGDGKLHPYKDFVIAPKYPGNRRAGYSY